jgi:hypothetical protein
MPYNDDGWHCAAEQGLIAEVGVVATATQSGEDAAAAVAIQRGAGVPARDQADELDRMTQLLEAESFGTPQCAPVSAQDEHQENL